MRRLWKVAAGVAGAIVIVIGGAAGFAELASERKLQR
jgi:hypothetical protein